MRRAALHHLGQFEHDRRSQRFTDVAAPHLGHGEFAKAGHVERTVVGRDFDEGELEDFPQDDPQASKVGGRAWWPEGEAAPVGQDGEDLVLLAQINFADMPASPGYPGTGLLQFFISPDEYYGANFDSDFSAEALSVQRGFRVAYWPDLLVPGRVLPANADEEFMTPHLPDKPRRMRFVADDELLSSSDYRFDPLLGGNAYKTLEAWAKANGAGTSVIEAVYHHLDGSGHKFGGYPYFTQTDPRQGGPHELLLQLDTDEDMMWGDSGVGGFFIDPADLARGEEPGREERGRGEGRHRPAGRLARRLARPGRRLLHARCGLRVIALRREAGVR
mgnify:CR=1 FL=1